MSKRAKAALASGLGLIALTATYLTAPWEGTKNLAYWDSLGKVWTVCTGETKGVKKGDRYSDAECAAMLYKTLEKDYYRPLTRCIPGFDGYPLSWQAAMLDLTYNIGAGTACSSTAARRAIAGDLKESCQATTWFNKAGGKTIRGLKLRREFGDKNRIGELELCLAGLDAPVVAAAPQPKPPAPAPETAMDADKGDGGRLVALGVFLAVLAGIGGLIYSRRRRKGK